MRLSLSSKLLSLSFTFFFWFNFIQVFSFRTVVSIEYGLVHVKILLYFKYISFQIDQSVFTVCPSRPDMRPGMLLVFELFILRGPVTPTDKVVGWGCFPVCDAEFNVIEGK